MEEERITIDGGSGRDKIEGVEELTDKIIICYNDKSGKISQVEVPRKIINFVGDYIEGLNVGERTKSVELYEAFIREFRVKSNIAVKHLNLMKQKIKDLNLLDDIRTLYLIEELERDDEFILQSWKEFIGSRKTERALYFKCWLAIRYWAQKEKIDYSCRGTITRLI